MSPIPDENRTWIWFAPILTFSIARKHFAVSPYESLCFHMPCLLLNDDLGDISVSKWYKNIQYLR